MSAHLERELATLRRRILSLGASVEDAIAKAVQAMARNDLRLAEQVIENDAELDRAEVEIEEECLKLLALYQPVAVDLRFIVAVLKMNNDLERMGDLAANIAKGARPDLEPAHVQALCRARSAASGARLTVKRSLDALVRLDAALAQQVCAEDDEVDALRHNLRRTITDRMRESPDPMDGLTAIFLAVGHLERLADMATNLAEDVVYMVDGKIIRHGCGRQ